MFNFTPDQWAQIITIVGSLLSGGTLVAFINWMANSKKSKAEARNVNVTAEVTLGEGWKAYADKMEKRFDESEKKFNERIKELEKTIDENKKAYEATLQIKNKEITDLTDAMSTMKRKNTTLSERVDNLQAELDKYKKMDQQTELAREDLHHSVDASIDNIKNPTV